MTKLTPRLTDIRLSFDLISHQTDGLSDPAYRALMQLVSFAAARLVWTYTPPSDGSIPADDAVMARITRRSRRQWLKVKPEVARFFIEIDGFWHLDRPWVTVTEGHTRLAIPTEIQRAIAARQGGVCTYCGTSDGPFYLDHIYPVSRGGSNEPSNLTLACASCNRSKGARTLREWLGR